MSLCVIVPQFEDKSNGVMCNCIAIWK